MREEKSLIPGYARLPLLVLLVVHLASYGLPKLFTGSWYHYNLETQLDRSIPFLPWTGLIYVGAYVFWVVTSVLCVRYDEKRAWRFLSADILSKVISFAFFVLLPTTNTRPAIEGNGLFDWLMRLIFTLDTPDNLLPSVHCMFSWSCWLGVRGEKRIPKWYRVFTLVFTLLVFVSTLTTKQHILVDVAAGVLISEVCYCISKGRLAEGYRRLYSRGN